MALRLKFWFLTLALCVALSLALEQQAHAYVDPGSSLLIFQSFGAVLSGVLFYFRRRLKLLFTRNSSKPAPADAGSVSTRGSANDRRA